MTTIQKVTQEEMIKKFSELAQNSLGTQLTSEHIAIVSERKPSKIKAVDAGDLVNELKAIGLNIPTLEDIAIVSVADMNQQNQNKSQQKTTSKFKR